MLMSSNLLLYPPDYSFGASGSGAVQTRVSTVSSAVEELQIQARNTALKKSHTRRIGGQNSIDNQNRAARAINMVLPLDQVGPSSILDSALGTAAYFCGGKGGYDPSHPLIQSITRLIFSGESLVPTGMQLTASRCYMGTVGESSAGRMASGLLAGWVVSDIIDRLTYREERLSRLSATLASPAQGSAGLSTKVYGYLIGGLNIQVLRTTNRFTFSTDTTAFMGSSLPSIARFAPHNGGGNRYSGYLFGGVTKGPSDPAAYLFVTSIDKLTYATETFSLISASLSASQVSHALVGNDVKSYIAGGASERTIQNQFINLIEAFTFGGEVVSPLGVTLSQGKECADGASSSLAGYIGGGLTDAAFIGSITIERLTFSSETISVMGVKLNTPLSDQGAVSDYGAGFIY